jgi:hypothetical protein
MYLGFHPLRRTALPVRKKMPLERRMISRQLLPAILTAPSKRAARR